MAHDENRTVAQREPTSERRDGGGASSDNGAMNAPQPAALERELDGYSMRILQELRSLNDYLEARL